MSIVDMAQVHSFHMSPTNTLLELVVRRHVRKSLEPFRYFRIQV